MRFGSSGGAPLSVPVITLGRLPDTISDKDLTPCNRLLYAMEAVAALTAGSHEFERYRGKLASRQEGGASKPGHMEPHWSISSLDNVEGVDRNYNSVEFKKLLASNSIWSSLNQESGVPKGEKLTPEERLIRERNRIFLLFTAKFFDLGLKLYLSKKPKSNEIFKDFDRNELREFLRKSFCLFKESGVSEIARCKSWEKINYRYAREHMFDWYCIGWAHSQPGVVEKIGGKTGGKANQSGLFKHLKEITLNKVEDNPKFYKEKN